MASPNTKLKNSSTNQTMFSGFLKKASIPRTLTFTTSKYGREMVTSYVGMDITKKTRQSNPPKTYQSTYEMPNGVVCEIKNIQWQERVVNKTHDSKQASFMND